MMYWKNLKHILLHKWYVLQECFKERLYWQGLIHDLSKFHPLEFIRYAQNFYGNYGGDVQITNAIKERFSYAWLHHQHCNKHHWNYWVVNQNKKEALDMPVRYAREMICDWKAKARELGDTAIDFYLKNKDKMVLAAATTVFIESKLEIGE